MIRRTTGIAITIAVTPVITLDIFAGKHVLTYNVSRHKHKNWELVYCTRDSGAFVFDGLELPYREGDIVVIPPQTPHEIISSGGFTNIHLNIDNATLTFRQPAVVRDDVNQSLLHLFADAYYLFTGDPARRAALLSSYGNLIVRHVSLSRAARPKNRVVEEIEQSIVQNYANPNYELDEALSSMPYCYDYLCRLFRQETCTTPHKYLTNLRLQVAADLLLSGHAEGGISEIAHACGFRDPLYFSRLFKKRYDVSPSEYARQKQQQRTEIADSDSQKISLE